MGGFRSYNIGFVEIHDRFNLIAHFDETCRDAILFLHCVNAEGSVDAGFFSKPDILLVLDWHIDAVFVCAVWFLPASVIHHHVDFCQCCTNSWRVRVFGNRAKVVGDEICKMASSVCPMLEVRDKTVCLAVFEMFGLDDVERIYNNIGCDPIVEFVRSVCVTFRCRSSADNRIFFFIAHLR